MRVGRSMIDDMGQCSSDVRRVMVGDLHMAVSTAPGATVNDLILSVPVLEQLAHKSHVTRHTSHITRHTSHVKRHTLHATRHTSHVTRHTSHVTSQNRRQQQCKYKHAQFKKHETTPPMRPSAAAVNVSHTEQRLHHTHWHLHIGTCTLALADSHLRLQ
jgi:hypothetical protein